MTEIANLEIRVDTKDLKNAIGEINKLAKAASVSTKATTQLGKSFSQASKQSSSVKKNIKEVISSLDSLSGSVDRLASKKGALETLKNNLSDVNSELKASSTSTSGLDDAQKKIDETGTKSKTLSVILSNLFTDMATATGQFGENMESLGGVIVSAFSNTDPIEKTISHLVDFQEKTSSVSFAVLGVTNALESLGNKGATGILNIAKGFKEAASTKLKGLTSGVKIGGKAFDLLVKGIGKFATAMKEAQKVNQKMTSDFKFLTGSITRAERAINGIEESARKTPFSLEETTKAFKTLAKEGLQPTEKGMEAYSNIAVVMDKSLDDVAKSVVKAKDGQISALTDLGFETEKVGDKIRVSFGNTRVTVSNDAQGIQDALTKFGVEEYAGATEERMATVSGSLTRFKGAWENLTRTIANSNIVKFLSYVVGKTIDVATDKLNEWEDRIDGVDDKIEEVNNKSGSATIEVTEKNNLVTSTSTKNDEGATPYTQADQDEEERDKEARVKAAQDKARAREDEFKALQESFKSEEELLKERYDHEAALVLEQTENNLALRQEFLENLKEQYKNEEQALLDKANAEFHALEQSYLSEEERLKQSYDRRLEIIDSAEKISEERRDALREKEKTKHAEELAALEEKQKEELVREAEKFEQELLTSGESYEKQKELLSAYYDERRQIIEDMQGLEKEVRDQHLSDIKTAEEESNKRLIKGQQKLTKEGYGKMFSGIMDIIKSFAGEQGKAYQAMFAISKASAIGESIVNIQTGITKAIKVGFPQNIPLIAGVISQAAGIVSTIKSTTLDLAGAFDHGGMIPSGQQGLVGEFGPELISGPAVITSRRTTADRGVQQNSGTKIVYLTNNYDFTNADRNVADELRQNSEQIENNIMGRLIEDGFNNGKVSQAMRIGS